MSLRKEILARVSAVPPLPEVVIKLRECCSDPEVDYAEMAAVIEMDAGLTASILRLANSAYFGCTGSISSVQFAMTRLGMKRVHQMALAVCVAPMVRGPVRGYDLDAEGLWEHSLAAAMAAEMLAKEVDGVETADAFTAGMLHDLGKTVLGLFVADEMEEIRRLVREDAHSFDEAERAVLGTDHAAVAGMLLRHWQLPPAIVDAVRWHHKPGGVAEPNPLLDVVHLADILCMDIGWGLGADGLEYRQDPGVARRLPIDNADGERIICRVLKGLEEIKELFEMTEEVH